MSKYCHYSSHYSNDSYLQHTEIVNSWNKESLENATCCTHYQKKIFG